MAGVVSWTQYRESIGDRSGLFAALVAHWPVRSALYLGSYVDLSPSTAIAAVTYVDTDARAARFFADTALVDEELKGRTLPGAGQEVAFLNADFTRGLDVPETSTDLLISLFTVPAWEHCRRHLRPRGLLLANSSHGEASLAAMDPALRLVAAVHHRAGRYHLDTAQLDTYLRPRRAEEADAERIRSSGRGVTYTRPAFAYLFEQT